MPDTSYYIDDHSRVKLFDYILSLNGKIIPDLNYSDENFIIISCSDQFLDFIDHKTVRFFIISDKFQVSIFGLPECPAIRMPAHARRPQQEGRHARGRSPTCAVRRRGVKWSARSDARPVDFGSERATNVHVWTILSYPLRAKNK